MGARRVGDTSREAGAFDFVLCSMAGLNFLPSSGPTQGDLQGYSG